MLQGSKGCWGGGCSSQLANLSFCTKCLTRPSNPDPRIGGLEGYCCSLWLRAQVRVRKELAKKFMWHRKKSVCPPRRCRCRRFGTRGLDDLVVGQPSTFCVGQLGLPRPENYGDANSLSLGSGFRV